MKKKAWSVVDGFAVDKMRPWLGGFRPGGDEATTYEALWEWLVKTHGVKSVADVGCGDGVAVKFFEIMLPFGEVIGIDGIPQEHLSIIEHDYTLGPLEIKACDMVWCVEFCEHVEERFVPNFLATFKCAPLILMTHAMPGQQGYHHVLCRTPHYWIGTMSAIGYRLDEELTARTRELAALNKNQYNHFKRSGLAFVRN